MSKTLCQITVWVVPGVVFLVLFASCAYVPQQTYIGKDKIKRFNRVVVAVSSAELDVKYSRETGMSIGTSGSIALFPLFGLAVMAAEGAGKSSEDRALAEDIKKDTNVIHFDGVLGGHFMGILKNANVFEIVGKTDTVDFKSHKKLLYEGYDFLIELDIKELALRREYADKLKVYANVWGRMIDLESEEVVWNRQEVVIGNDEHTIESFKADGGKILKETVDQVFRKIAARLANDFIYLR